ncbi:T-cell-specific guanine nucleotide triphosphate-binding protein 2-like [Mercenaria mercenaria]|uniref:T-cell-specific guanine nucleotide triphosphate-binding protein 2-like n=1 Tax=Mercenaria mercenaria TaxID=6596 RepID=UPI00234FADC0|nr:T-cell-specific guanine nucleotide triphosphate-binding protein 2-like [Mercenaria mercenaria]
MDALKKEYQDWMDSSDVWHETDENKFEGSTADNIDDKIKVLEGVLKDKGIEGVKQELSSDLDKWKNTDLHIAVTGSSGAGKSAFINAIRDVCADDEGGAEVGVTETTMELTPYKHPKNPNFIVWDMPGVGTPKYPKDKYLTCVKFDRYDFFMILSKSRFTEEDLWLAKQIQERKKRFYFVRTNIDIDIYNDSRAHPKSHSAQDVMGKVRQDCHTNLDAADIEAPLVFLIDNHDKLKYEFGQLELQLLQDSDSLKMEAIALSLSVLTSEVLQKKKDVLEKRIAEKAMEIACVWDDVDRQKQLFEDEILTYKEQFNIDDKTLSANKDVLSLTDANLKEFKKFFKDLSKDTVSQLSKKSASLSGRSGSFIRILRQSLLGYQLIIFQLGEGFRSHSQPVLQFSCFALHQNLGEMYKMALKVYDLNAQKSFVKSIYKP